MQIFSNIITHLHWNIYFMAFVILWLWFSADVSVLWSRKKHTIDTDYGSEEKRESKEKNLTTWTKKTFFQFNEILLLFLCRHIKIGETRQETYQVDKSLVFNTLYIETRRHVPPITPISIQTLTLIFPFSGKNYILITNCLILKKVQTSTQRKPYMWNLISLHITMIQFNEITSI